MSRSIPWEPFSAGTGVLVLAGVCTWLWLDVIAPPQAVVPGHRGAPFVPLSAAMPEIAEFREFNVNDDNPFVPFREREAERRVIKSGGAKVVIAPPRKAVTPVVIDPPVKKLPPPAAGGGDAPKVVGSFGASGAEKALIVRFKGETATRMMKPGETVGRWTFVAIEAGNVALFRDQDAREYRLVIGGR